ncbi:MAG: DUF1080 domain-containing protein [Pedosphaera sp.]|nr:DUF1080 domain-containing protein [Pedosphaera sp.]
MKCRLSLLAVISFTLLAATDPKEPAVVTAGVAGSPPSDAIVLFDGKDLSAWKSEDGTPSKWAVTDGYAEMRGKSILTRQEFGSIQLHIEWASPAEVKGEGQGRGNSGVYFQGRYEIQVLDSWRNKTYFNGQASAFYGHNAPLVNASRKPGEWQAYDIIFHPPTPSAEGKIVPGSFTVFHNGVLVQDHIPISGDATTSAKFSGATPTGPLMLQDHGNPVRYRNIWLRKLD